MELEAGVLVSPAAEVPVVEGEIVTAIRELASRGIGSKAIAREVGVARNTVRRYLRRTVAVGVQVRPTARASIEPPYKAVTADRICSIRAEATSRP